MGQDDATQTVLRNDLEPAGRRYRAGAGHIRVLLILAVTALVGLGVVTPATAQTCERSSLVGNFVIALGGVNAAGRHVTLLASVWLGPTRSAPSSGPMLGAMFVNERGSDVQEVEVASNYFIESNCVVHLFIPDGDRRAVITGLAVDGAQFIALSSIFDPAVQLTGTARKFP